MSSVTLTSPLKNTTVKLPKKKQRENHVKNMMSKIIETANEIKDKVQTLDFDYVNINEKFFSKFFQYSSICNDIKTFIQEQTNFKYEPFQNISVTNTLSAPEKLVFISRLSNIFNEPFINSVDANWKFDKLESAIIKFIEKFNKSTDIEYKLIKSLLGKMIVLMLSDVEQAFATENVNMNEDCEKYLKSYVESMTSFGNIRNCISKSWSTFVNCLFNKSEAFILKHDDLETPEKLLMDGYSNHFMLEIFAANILKTFQTNIMIDYFHAIRYCYIWVRLVSILIQNSLEKGLDKNKLMENIYTISVVITSMYEDLYFISSILPKSLPMNEDLSEETILYFLNHTIKGPQYMILKQLELSGPCILNIR